MEKFPNLNEVEVEAYILKLFNNVDERKLFKGVVRDLMVSMKQFSNQQNDFYAAEMKMQ